MSIPVMGLILLVLATLGMFGYRKFAMRGEDELVHLGSGSVQHSARQDAMAKTVAQLDMVTRTLLIVTVVYGVGLFGIMIYQALQNGPG